MRRLVSLVRFLCGLTVFVMMGLIVISVALRSFRVGFIPGNEEFIGFFIALTIYLGVSPLQKEKGHIRVMALWEYLPRRMKALADFVAWLFFLVFFAIILWQNWEMLVTSWRSGERFHGVYLPVYPIRFLIVLGCLFMVIQLIVDLMSSWREFIKGERRTK
jgi:TRAP-type C4-dicarboxylate transport system permease small subunit